MDDSVNEVIRAVEQLNTLDAFGSQNVAEVLESILELYRQNEAPVFRAQYPEKLVQHGFIDLLMKMKKWLNLTGPLRDDLIWGIHYYMLSIVMSFTDQSMPFSQKLVEADFMRFVVADLKHPPYLQNMYSSQNVGHLMTASIGIIHNSSKVVEVREKFSELGTVEVLQPFVKSPDETIKVLSLLSIAHIINEEENDKIMASEDFLVQLVQLLQRALKDPGHHCGGFSAEELTEGLGLLAVNDSNKKKIVDAHALPSLKQMMASSNQKEKRVALKSVSNLAFHADVRATLQKDSGLMSSLQEITKSSDEEMKRLASGALWVINEKSEQKKKEAEKKATTEVHDAQAPVKKGHVMISYNWANQPMLLKVRDALHAAGYTVWMDVDDISGSTLQAMAEAVEGASLVLMCMSEKYKNSPNCRIEAEYAFQRQKTILPLLMQRGYKADGWLGIMLGAKLFVDFSDKYPFEKSTSNMLAQIKHMLNESSTEKHDGSSKQQPAAPARVESSHLFVKWTADDVAKWLKDSGLEKFVAKFKGYTGKSINQLLEVRRSAPEFYYKSMKEEIGLQFLDTLKLNDALDTLP